MDVGTGDLSGAERSQSRQIRQPELLCVVQGSRRRPDRLDEGWRGPNYSQLGKVCRAYTCVHTFVYNGL